METPYFESFGYVKCVNDQPYSFKRHCLALFFYAGLICQNVYTVFTRISAAALT